MRVRLLSRSSPDDDRGSPARRWQLRLRNVVPIFCPGITELEAILTAHRGCRYCTDEFTLKLTQGYEKLWPKMTMTCCEPISKIQTLPCDGKLTHVLANYLRIL